MVMSSRPGEETHLVSVQDRAEAGSQTVLKAALQLPMRKCV